MSAVPIVQPCRANARAFVRALRQFGFIIVPEQQGHREVVDNVLFETRRFFQTPQEEKDKIMLDGMATGFRGYQPQALNVTGGVKDSHEGLDIMRTISTDELKGYRCEDMLNKEAISEIVHTDNLWPTGQPSLERAYNDYINAMLPFGKTICDTIAEGFALETGKQIQDSDRFSGIYSDDPFWLCRGLHYPNDGLVNDSRQGCGEHTDYGLLTMICQEPVPGCLEIKLDGKWVSVDPVPNHFVINIGDVLQDWTDGYFMATPHRVLSPEATSRISVPFFYEPKFDAVIHDSPTRVTTYAEHLFSKFSGNFSFAEESML
eukprot:CAMPEP_0203749506 /NCGR_PEP_ID=MMETSP0098-20131031/4050_1 /ASSEMBLY_ACC=CAM_ASM_000208 /TAXON_ID=96639 /ORGANISM=" , Strain NY0313808BC1" /LENGTH=317 /DNA_ID=CAMNT_0050638579 /DNA_START=26 /DNA_END=979 /DNA_ORIENTATION=+